MPRRFGILSDTAMQITEDTPGNEVRYAIRGYGPGEVRINERIYTHSVIVSRNRLTDWTPPPIAEWTPEDLDALLELDPEILLLGTGARLHMLGTPFLAHALRHGVGLEVMDTGAACRTYNVLVSEGRRVVAGLIIE
jgi:uncharacterized protein